MMCTMLYSTSNVEVNDHNNDHHKPLIYWPSWEIKLLNINLLFPFDDNDVG